MTSEASKGSEGGKKNYSVRFLIRETLEMGIGSGGVFIVDVDIEKCFDTIPHEPLIDMVAEEVADGSVLELIRTLLTTPIAEGYRYVKRKAGLEVPEEGTAQGSPVSPLLFNIYLAQLDRKLEGEGIHFSRYADDIRATGETAQEAREAKERIGEGLKALGLKMSATKTKMTTANQGVNFLGYRLNRFKGKIYALVPRDRVRQFKDRVRTLTRRNSDLPKEVRLIQLGNYIGGWCEYFKRAQQPMLFHKLDGWIYRRLVAMYAGRWRTMLFKKYTVKYFREEHDIPSLYWMHKEYFRKPRMPQIKRATSSCSA